jgi:hypothetical protein
MNNKKLTSIALSILLLTSSITIFGAFIFFPVQEAEAQAIQLRVSGAEFPQWENHFYGPQIQQIVINHPTATDPDESTIGLQVRGENVPKVHLSDGLWYHYVAEEDFFSIYLDISTDGVRDNNIAVQDPNPAPGRSIGAESFTFSTNTDSWIREITKTNAGLFFEVSQTILFPTMAQPFFETSDLILNGDLELNGKNGDLNNGPDDGPGAEDNGMCTADEFDEYDTDCDWPYIRTVPLNQREQLGIRAGTESVTLTFNELPDAISTSLNRASYPVGSEIMYKFNDFQWNINPEEVDQVWMVLDHDSGRTVKVMNSPRGAINLQDVLPIYPDLDFDERQVLELDSEGVASIVWIFAHSPSLKEQFDNTNGAEGVRNGMVNFVPERFILEVDNGRTVAQFTDIEETPWVYSSTGGPSGTTPIENPGDLHPVVRINEASAKPNSGFFNTGQAGKGSRTTIFAGERDRVASFDYNDIITSAPIAVHDGFASVDREVYDSADRSVFTITDPDQNLRSSVSESPDGRDAKNIIEVGDPITLVNTRTAGIFNPELDNVLQVWNAVFLSSEGDTEIFGSNSPGANMTGVNMTSIGFPNMIGFHAAADDIASVGILQADNNRFSIPFTPGTIGDDNSNGIIIDTSVTIEDITKVAYTAKLTQEEIDNQVRVDNLEDGNAIDDQEENFVKQVARMSEPDNNDMITVEMPMYNLLHVDITNLETTQGVSKLFAKIDAVDPDCMNQVDSTVAFATTCVSESQIVDFDIEDQIDLNGDSADSRIAVGAFRALDFDTTDVMSTDQVRVTLLIVDRDGEPNEIITAQASNILVDIIGLGVVFDPAPTDRNPDNIASPIGATFSNVAYRLELDEEGSNSSIFSGRADFLTFRQFDTVADVIDDIVLTGDPVKIWLPNRFIPPNRLAFTYFDADIVDFFREVSATFIYETRDGMIEWDRSSFSFGQDAFLTITDEDLNRSPDSRERYDLPIDSFVFLELGKERVCTDEVFCASGTPGSFFDAVDATLLETGTNTGKFVAQVTMPREILLDATPGTPGTPPESVITQQRDFEINYIDIRDRSSITQEFDDVANIRTTRGDVVLDRAAMPPGSIMFQEIHDNDYNTNVDIRERIDLRQLVVTSDIVTGEFANTDDGTTFGFEHDKVTTNAGEVDLATALVTDADFADLAPIFEINIFKSGTGRLVSMLPVGITTADGTPADPRLDDRFGQGITTGEGSKLAVLPLLDRNGVPVIFAEETGPNTGIFEFEVRLPGPAREAGFPVTLPSILTAGTLDNPVITSNLPIQATYFDPSDESGESEDEQELATFLTNTARLRTDRLEYGLGDRLEILIEEPDFNLDSRSIDEVEFSILDIVTDKFDTEFGALADARDFGTVIDELSDTRTNLTKFRETDFNSGVFVVAIEELTNSLIDRGETARLLYFDKTPSGGGSEIRVQYSFLVVAILPEIVFDKEEYTPFDEVIVSIISPDSNNDPDRIETISPLISSSSESLGRDTFPESGPNTGIFEEDFDLTPSKDRFPGDLRAVREDGITIEFRIDSDTVATKSVFVNYHVGQVMFDKDAFSMVERGVLRVIDPDANQNPDTIDTLSVRFWSTSDRGGLLVTLRETGDRTGIFEEIITFTPDEESSGTRLRVTEGDTITAKYTDNTLPAPAALDADEIFTVEVEELFASALMGATVALLERAVASEIDIVDQTGAILEDASIGSQILVQSTIANSQTKKQPFAYIVQIKDVNGVTVSLSWVSGELPPSEALSVAQSWIPEAKGEHVAEVFVWESIDTPTALSPVRTTTIIVT